MSIKRKYKVPFADFKLKVNNLKNLYDEAYERVLDSGVFVFGEEVKCFEKTFASLHHVSYCIACGNGTDALEISLRALGIGEGDEVIVPANTWISDSETVSLIGAKPVFADVSLQTYNLSPDEVLKKITKRTKAIIFVHLFGNTSGFSSIKEIASMHHLSVIEDCAQAHNAMVHNKKVGTLGEVGCFSFYPSKNLGALGDAGAITCKDSPLATKIRQTANHGQIKKNMHVIEGRNSRMDELQAAFLSVHLNYLDEWTAMRKKLAALYIDLLKGSEIGLPYFEENHDHVYHLFVIRVKKRKEVQEYLESKGIQTFIHYPQPLPFTKAYSYLGHVRNDFPNADILSKEILSLPLYPEISEEQIRYVCKCVLEIC